MSHRPAALSAWSALYRKELRALRLPAAVLLVGSAVLVGYVLAQAGDGQLHPSMVLLGLPYLCPPVLAGLLIHTVGQEWSARTQHLWLALPLPRSLLLLAKVAAVLTVGVGVYLIATAGLHAIHGQIADTLGFFTQSPQPQPDTQALSVGLLWVATAAIFGGSLVLLLGLALLAAVLRQVVQRLRAAVTVGVFLGGLWLTTLWGPTLTGPLREWMPGAGSDGHLEQIVVVYGYLALMGLLFGAAGAWLFDRRVDA